MFEDSIVELFENADIDKDGLIDYEDFYNVSQCISVKEERERGREKGREAGREGEVKKVDGGVRI